MQVSYSLVWFQAGTGIAELIALEMSRQTNAPLEETRKKIWLVDSKGLIVSSRKNSLQEFKKRWAHEHEPVSDLLGAVKVGCIIDMIRHNVNMSMWSWQHIHMPITIGI